MRSHKFKGFSLNALASVALMFVIITIVLAMGGRILEGVRDEQTSSSIAYNATTKGLEGIGTFADWMPLLAIIIISVIVISMLMGGFGRSMGGGGRA